jgi:hypothetical protein
MAQIAGVKPISQSIASEFCHKSYSRNLGLVHLHERSNGLFQRDCPADKLFGRQFPVSIIANKRRNDVPASRGCRVFPIRAQ